MPNLQCVDAQKTCKISTLKSRRTELWKGLFKDMKADTHILNELYFLHVGRALMENIYLLLIVKTGKYKYSFLPYCLLIANEL